MFERPHHRRIARVLQAMDGKLLDDARCYFGGGTAISLLLGEYRESIDIDSCAPTSAAIASCAPRSSRRRSAAS